MARVGSFSSSAIVMPVLVTTGLFVVGEIVVIVSPDILKIYIK